MKNKIKRGARNKKNEEILGISIYFIVFLSIIGTLSFIMAFLFLRPAFCKDLIFDSEAVHVSTVIYSFCSVITAIMSATLLYRTIVLQIKANDTNSANIATEQTRIANEFKIAQYANFSNEISNTLYNIECIIDMTDGQFKQYKGLNAIVEYFKGGDNCGINDTTFLQIVHLLQLLSDFIKLVNDESNENEFLSDNIYVQNSKRLYKDCLQKILNNFCVAKEFQSAVTMRSYTEQIEKLL